MATTLTDFKLILQQYWSNEIADPPPIKKELRAHMAVVTSDWIQSGYVNHASRICAYSWTWQSTRNPSNSPKEIRIMYLELVRILPIKFHHDHSTLSIFPGFQDFPFPPSTSHCPGFNSNWNWSIWDMTSFYISSFIRIRSTHSWDKHTSFFMISPPSTPS